MAKFIFGRVENVGEGENDGYQHFLAMFSKGCFLGVFNTLNYVVPPRWPSG